MALALEGTLAPPHFDCTAFKVARTHVTLSADGRSAKKKPGTRSRSTKKT